MEEATLIRQNMMDDKDYKPYCGNDRCPSMPRTKWDTSLMQMYCPICGWVSQFPKEFIDRYKAKHNL